MLPIADLLQRFAIFIQVEETTEGIPPKLHCLERT